MLCSFYLFKERCPLYKSNRLPPCTLIYRLQPLPIKAWPVHELVVWDMQYSMEYSKKKNREAQWRFLNFIRLD